MNERITPRDPDELRDTAAAFVLGALPEIEEQSFRRELLRDPELAEYVARLQPAADRLLSQLQPVSPPPSLDDSVRAAVAADAEASRVLDPGRRRKHRTGGSLLGGWLLRPAAGFAAATLLLVGSFMLGREFGGDEQPPRPVTASMPLNPVADRDAGGRVTMTAGGERGAVVRVSGLRPSRKGAYQLWVQHGERVSPATVFEVDHNGSGTAMLDQDMTGVVAVMITEEPPGGSPAPTGEVLAKAEMPQS